VGAMKLFQAVGLIATTMAAGLAGCSKPEQTTAVPHAPTIEGTTPAGTAAVPSPAPVATPTLIVTPTVSVPVAAAAFDWANFKMPDLQSASVAQLGTVAGAVLSGLGDKAGAASPGVLAQVAEVKNAIAGGKALEALASLSKLGNTVKAIPGAQPLLLASKQLVSAWALKQGFDVNKISGVLGSLQKGDMVGLAAQAASLLGKGGVSGEQKGLLDGVLGNFGVNPGAAAAATGALKGLLGK